jgi:hypothetical protein
MYNQPIEGVEVDADKAKYMRITMKIDGAPEETGRFYFRDQGTETFTESRAVSFKYSNNTDGYFEIIVDLSNQTYWKGPIRYMRLDPCSSEAKFSIKSIEFLSGSRKDGITFNIDGYEFGINNDQVTSENGEIYIEESDCPDKVCVRSGRISKSGEGIICAPNRVAIKINGEKGNLPDAMTG